MCCCHIPSSTQVQVIIGCHKQFTAEVQILILHTDHIIKPFVFAIYNYQSTWNLSFNYTVNIKILNFKAPIYNNVFIKPFVYILTTLFYEYKIFQSTI